MLAVYNQDISGQLQCISLSQSDDAEFRLFLDFKRIIFKIEFYFYSFL